MLEICDARTPGHKPPVAKPVHETYPRVRIRHEEGNIFEVISSQGFKYYWYHEPEKLNAFLDSVDQDELNLNPDTGLLQVNDDWLNLSPRPVPNCEARNEEIIRGKYFINPFESALLQAKNNLNTFEARRFFKHIEVQKEAMDTSNHQIKFDAAETPYCSCGLKAANLYFGYNP